MRSSEIEQLLMRDPLLTVFRTFCQLEDILVTSSLSIVSHENFATSVAERSAKNGDDMIVVSWTPITAHTMHGQPATQPIHNPFDGLFKANAGTEATSSGIYSHFLRDLFAKSSVDVALFIDRGPGGQSQGGTGGAQHLFLPFIGGPDDRLALSFVVQLRKHPLITATVVRMCKVEPDNVDLVVPGLACAGQGGAAANNDLTIHSMASGFPDTVYAPADTQTQLASDTLDNMMWSRCSTKLGSKNITFKTVSSPRPLHSIISLAQTLGSTQRLISIVGRGKRRAVELHDEMKELGGSGEVAKTAGDVCAALFGGHLKGPIVVLQAAYTSRREEQG
ncbi:unnamed protein product [Rhizoctonia solani]|uniref:Uncharacterized protein n=1 Tax=Rhizoctonia solani TaxID=456999 RepID=A0A8H3B3K3_9AGAM|nr:unnamed protein product [Rhizoctonia solani]